MVAGVWSDNSNLQLEATTQFRKLLSIGTFLCIMLYNLFVYCLSSFAVKFELVLITVLSIAERSPPIEEVIQSGVVPRFVEFLVREDFPQLQVLVHILELYYWVEFTLVVLFVPTWIYVLLEV